MCLLSLSRLSAGALLRSNRLVTSSSEQCKQWNARRTVRGSAVRPCTSVTVARACCALAQLLEQRIWVPPDGLFGSRFWTAAPNELLCVLYTRRNVATASSVYRCLVYAQCVLPSTHTSLPLLSNETQIISRIP